MITNRRFNTAFGNILSDVEYNVKNGLQQSTFNSPILFNIYTADVLRLFGTNASTDTKAIAFADYLIIYSEDAKSYKVNYKLQDTFDRIQRYYTNWKLKINTSKCETILFRRPTTTATNEVNSNYKNFRIIDRLKQDQAIPHKKIVKYLGINLDERITFSKHIDIQIKKTKAGFAINRALFNSKYLNEKVKIIAYICA